MERDEASIGKVRQQAREVAVADEDFRVTPDGLEIDSVQQIIGAVAAARAEDGTHIIAFNHFFKLADTAVDGSGEVEIAIENRIEIERLVSSTAQGFASGVQIGLFDVAGRRDDCNGVAGLECGRLDELEISSWHESDETVQLRKNSPRHNNFAGPRKKTLSPTWRTVCTPPGACTLTGEAARPMLIAAAADAQEPVPDELVSPTPRSKKRTRMSNLLSTTTNSTFTPSGNCGMPWISAACACQLRVNSFMKTT